jgi:hypothetical protein
VQSDVKEHVWSQTVPAALQLREFGQAAVIAAAQAPAPSQLLLVSSEPVQLGEPQEIVACA